MYAGHLLVLPTLQASVSRTGGSRGAMNFTKKDNGLNQYRAWLPYSNTNYDDDVSGWGSPSAANGVRSSRSS